MPLSCLRASIHLKNGVEDREGLKRSDSETNSNRVQLAYKTKNAS
jgi:hypothetical protein